MMDYNNQDIKDKIKEQTEQIKVPESLEPDNIEEKLLKKGHKRKWNKGVVSGLCAACLLVVFGVVFGITKDVQKREVQTPNKVSKGYKQAESYDEVYACIEEISKQKYGEKAMESAPKSAMEREADYSETNVRQEGVDEADVVKTDGTYLYVLQDGGVAISIVEPGENGLKKQGVIQLEEGETAIEFFIKGEKLVIVSGQAEWNNGVMPLDGARTKVNTEPVTKLATYDIKDVSAPRKVGEVTQSGSYTTARMEGDFIYLFSRYNLNGKATKENVSSFVPAVNNELIPNEKIMLPSVNTASLYVVITSVDLSKPGEVKDSRALLTSGGNLYMSNQNIYWYEQKWEENITILRKFSYEKGEIKGVASGEIKGFIDDSFSIDEYKGYLRVVTTYKETNGIYILDEKLRKAGAIEGLAKEERVRSARFMGEVAYFVTFKEVDPLFSVDLSNPEKPKILGELKIPGFSEYLHPYGDNQLLGIGLEVDEETLSTIGVKLSMFDIGDKTDVKEVQKQVMENMYSADALNDYRAVLIDEQKNIIGFSGYSGGGERYYLFSYNKNDGFVCEMEEAVNGSSQQPTRGVFIEDALYVVKGNVIEEYSLKDYSKTSDIIL